jgi:hypothetical protein
LYDPTEYRRFVFLRTVLLELGHAELISCTIIHRSKSKGNNVLLISVAAALRIIGKRPERLSRTKNNNLQITITTDILTPQSIPVPALKLDSDMILKPRMPSIDVQTRTAHSAILWLCY